MARWYGAEGLARGAGRAAPACRGQCPVAKPIRASSIALDRAVSVLAHTPAAFEAARATGMVPAYQLDLPFRPSKTAPSPNRAQDGPLRLVQFGHIGPNRRLGRCWRRLAP